MKDFLKQFASVTNYNTWKSSEDYIEPNVSLIENEGITYNPIVQHDYSKDYLTFTILEDIGRFEFSQPLQYSLDNGSTWTTLAAFSFTPILSAGDKILWKQTGLTANSTRGIGIFDGNVKFEVSGNIMSLLYGDDFDEQTDLTEINYAFFKLFYNCTDLVSAENLILPATTLAQFCYCGMFEGCTSLTTAPELPTTTLVNYCYQAMFSGCTSLTTAPKLPATTLAISCYSSMFSGCTALTTAPTLPVTTLAMSCYSSMFSGCTSLTTAPELPATTLAIGCYSSMFQRCTKLITAPELLATILVKNCYKTMFEDCFALNYIKCLAIDISASNCITNWLDNVGPTGTFVKDASMTSWTTDTIGIPSGWTVQDAA